MLIDKPGGNYVLDIWTFGHKEYKLKRSFVNFDLLRCLRGLAFDICEKILKMNHLLKVDNC